MRALIKKLESLVPHCLVISWFIIVIYSFPVLLKLHFFYSFQQLGGPLSLPWGLYVLLCQVYKYLSWIWKEMMKLIVFAIISEECFFFFFTPLCSEGTRETMLKWCDRGWNMEKGTCGNCYFSCCLDSCSCWGWACRGTGYRSCNCILMFIYVYTKANFN